jgi:hypothetical protein
MGPARRTRIDDPGSCDTERDRGEVRRKARLVERLRRKHGKGKALSILAHKLGRAVYYMMAREKTFDMQRFASC